MNDYCMDERKEYIDNFTLTKHELNMYDIASTEENVKKLVFNFKKARNIYLNGCHLRLTQNYEPQLEGYTPHKSDQTANVAITEITSKETYNEFNAQLSILYSLMSKCEIAYINDCLIGGASESSVREQSGYYKDKFEVIKHSAIVRLALAFDKAVYK